MNNDELVLAERLKKELESLPEQKFYSFGTEMKTLDYAVGQIGEGDFIVIGGSAGQGKTSFCIYLTKELVKQGVKPLWFSIELTPKEFLSKFDEETIKFFYMPRKINEPKLSWLEKRIDEGISKYGINIVFIDHIGMIMDEKDYRDRSGVEILDERLKVIKSWAVNKGISIIAISPVTQGTAKTKEPTLADFRGTAMVGHTADLALFIKRVHGVKKPVILNERLEENEEPFMSTEADIYILKCRRTGMIHAKVRVIMDDNGNFVEI